MINKPMKAFLFFVLIQVDFFIFIKIISKVFEGNFLDPFLSCEYYFVLFLIPLYITKGLFIIYELKFVFNLNCMNCNIVLPKYHFLCFIFLLIKLYIKLLIWRNWFQERNFYIIFWLLLFYNILLIYLVNIILFSNTLSICIQKWLRRIKT